MSSRIKLDHGSGGTLTTKLIREAFSARFGIPEPLTDSAILEPASEFLAFTTDAYVVDPVFFPGGDIGKLAVCGTVNDLAVSGAIPLYISASFIIEEGFPMEDLMAIAGSMAAEAEKAGVKIVTGDTKVVEKGKCDKIFITTSGTGKICSERLHIGKAEKLVPGDRLIVNGPLGNHSIAVLGARRELGFTSPVYSDCASLNCLINKMLEGCCEVHFMRDITRGGLAAVLNELARIRGAGIEISEISVPVDEPVKGLCEILGFDPLYLANEGKILIAAGANEYRKALELLHSDPLGQGAAVIGEVKDMNGGKVVLNTVSGGKRMLDLPSGMQLPRIC